MDMKFEPRGLTNISNFHKYVCNQHIMLEDGM